MGKTIAVVVALAVTASVSACGSDSAPPARGYHIVGTVEWVEPPSPDSLNRIVLRLPNIRQDTRTFICDATVVSRCHNLQPGMGAQLEVAGSMLNPVDGDRVIAVVWSSNR